MANWWDDAAVVDAAPSQGSGSPLDRALKAEGVTGKLADLARSIYTQESSAGADTATSDAGAVGGMQMKPATFKRFADKGWSIENPEENARAAVRYIKSLSDKTGGDAHLISVGYYGGEGAIPKARAGIAVRDPRNPNAPNTLQYANDVTGRLPAADDSDWWKAAPVVAADAAPSDQGTPQQPAQPEPTRAQQDLRGLGLGVRNVAEGAASPLTFLGDTLNRGVNLGIRGVNALTGASIPQLALPSQTVNNALTSAGLPQPATPTERVLGDIQAGAAGALTGAGLSGAAAGAVANPMARNALAQLADRPRMQALSAATGAGAAGITREEGGGPGAQLAASLLGSLAPSATIAGGAAATRNALRGSAENIPDMLDRMKTFQEAGSTTPSVGQVTGNRNSQALESLLAKTPGGAGQMAKKAEQQAEEIGTRATKIADDLSPNATPSVAGRTIEKGLSGPGGFVDRFKQGQTALYNKLDQFIKPNTAVKVDRTKQALAAMNQDIPGAENLSRFFKNSKIQDIERALKDDTGSTQSAGMTVKQADRLPYEALKKLRTLVGDEISNNSLASDVPRSKWKALYAALSSDLDDAAKATGNPAAVKAMQRANTFSRAGYARIEDVLDKVAKQDIPEKVFKSAVNAADMQAGATKIGSIMKSLTPAERDVVKSAYIRRMGLASAGQQGAEGERFSTQTFLTNWNKMSPQAKSVMFSGQDGRLRVALDQIAKSAESIKSGSRVFSNPSGTSHAAAQIGLVSGVAGAIASGHVGVAAGLLGGAAGANLTARLMTYQPFVQWLAKSTKISPAAVPAALSSLARSMQSAPDDVKQDANQYAAALR
ncbi:transglycosylase SLT domain-containing protein [Paraburkholderia silviterrae]|uniref:Lytic transglycosylase domain-containing protein n=1 Tax=Paraburkholderia silviterrae TaxID=2528715 RepID=A0A4R5MF25_9BURK|nr:lytic transglycosylase domain-containing protein [Paraburkholderia silviterrae]TDG25851.1 lytic transglycosylase domain-containing protein [Paraburkholderia silviterrae]